MNKYNSNQSFADKLLRELLLYQEDLVAAKKGLEAMNKGELQIRGLSYKQNPMPMSNFHYFETMMFKGLLVEISEKTKAINLLNEALKEMEQK